MNHTQPQPFQTMTATCPKVFLDFQPIKVTRRYAIHDKQTNKFLFEYDPVRDMVRVRSEGRDIWVSIAALRGPEPSAIDVHRVET